MDEPNPTLSTPAVTTYTYDTLDNLTGVVQSGSRPRTFTYNSLSQLLSATNPESGTIGYEYDNDGNLVKKTDARGVVTCFGTWTGSTCDTSGANAGYDELHRLKKKTYSDGTPTATFTYDAASVDGLSIQFAIGRLVKSATSNTRTVQTYDNLGRIATQWQCTPANCGTGWYSSTLTYNEIGGALTQMNPMGFTLTQQWNAAAVMTALTSSWSDATHPAALGTVNTFNAGGAVTQMTLGNGLIETRAFNPRGQVLEMRAYDPATSTDKIRLTYGYVDASGKNNGNVMSWAAAGAQVFMRSYTYDGLNRIGTMAAPTEACAGLSWNYDIWGNRKDQTTTAGACGESHLGFATSNRINSANYQYDLAGNLTAEPGGRTYQYDAENRLVTVNGGAVASYVYDPNGQRVEKHVGATTTVYLYNPAGEVVAEANGGDTMQKGYVYLSGSMLAQYSDSTTYFAHKDHLGSTRLLTKPDKSYSPSDLYDFLPFGESNSAGSTTHKFTDKERDAETGLDYFGARYYAPLQGRFSTPDAPFADQHPGDPQSWNLYPYVRNNPLYYVDPTGQGAARAAVKHARKVLQNRLVVLARRQGVNAAWRLEKQLVEKTGKGSREWTDSQKAELLKTGRVEGFQGHHINSVAHNSIEMARDPGNIKFVKGQAGNLSEHGGNFQNPTSGELIDRLAMLGGTALTTFFAVYDQKVAEYSGGSPLVCPPDSWASYVNPLNSIIENAALADAFFAALAVEDEERRKKEEEERKKKEKEKQAQ